MTVWTALIGVVAGGLVTLGSTLIQQRRMWRREDRVRGEVRAVEQRREQRREVLKLFTEFLAACNQVNVAFALPDGNGDADGVRRFRDLVTERWAAVQAAGVVFMAVGHDEAMRKAISVLIDATEALVMQLRRLEPPTAEQERAFSMARRSCERGMRSHLAELAA